MIDADMRKAIYQLHRAGMPLRDISRQLRVSRNSVRRIIRQQGALPRTVRKDKIQIDAELLRQRYDECDGWVQRMQEKLVTEEKIQGSYPTPTRLVRELGLGRPLSARCDHVPDEPGAEMQHDTTVYRVKLAEQSTRVVASLLTGYEYVMTPTNTYSGASGPCREYTMDATIGGQTEQVYGTACRQPDGSWQISN